MNDLTDRQRAILDYIKSQAMLGQQPAVREMCEHFGGVQVNAISGHLRALEKKGYIKRSGGNHRRIEIVDWSPAIELRRLHERLEKLEATVYLGTK